MRRAVETLLGTGFDPPATALVPASVLPSVDRPDGRRRSTRDWIVDLVSTALTVVVGGLLWTMEAFLTGEGRPPRDEWVLWADALLGVVALVALWFRRRFPVGVALFTIAAASISSVSTVPAAIAGFGVAVNRPVLVAVLVNALSIPTIVVYKRFHQDTIPLWVMMLFSVAIAAALVAWGMFVRARRQVMVSLGDRAVRAEAERELHAERARHTERTRIAREMHDVLAHRLSLLSLQAGALAHRSGDASRDEIRDAAEILRASSREALDELRSAIGLLRETGEPAPPQPTLGDLPALIAECRAAGTPLTATLDVAEPEGVPTTTARSAYRIVQEALTNARKHAPHAAVTVRTEGRPGDALVLEVVNRLPLHVPDANGGGDGAGLIGLHERVELLGGRLDAGPTEEGDFRLRATLPWPAA